MSPPLLLPHSFSLVNAFFFLLLFFFFFFPIYVASTDAEGYTACAPFSCGNFSDISYPFWSSNQPDYCGHPKFKLDCQQDNLTIDIKSQKFQVFDIIEKSQILKIARLDLLGLGESGPCPEQINVSFDLDFFSYTSNYQNYTILYDCPDPYTSLPLNFASSIPFTCLIDGASHAAYLVLSSEVGNFNGVGCKNVITVPVQSPTSYSSSVGNVLGKGFEVKWSGVNGDKCDSCTKSGGRCGYDSSENASMCLCPNQQSYGGICDNNSTPKYQQQSPSNQWDFKRKILIGSAGIVFVGLLMCITMCCFKHKSSAWNGKFWLVPKSNQDIEAFLKNQGAFTLKRYKFSDIEKMTNFFKIKLGQGGFGAVFKGKLLTGSTPVAVKILNPSKEKGEEFINEVASISRTSHINVVTLLGFCLEGPKKALIYEFMPNGSLDKFIYKKGSETIASLSWDNLYEISIGIARGLEYLHKGCNTRILHFDIKPHNILLDENFCPKISDFGLAKLCPGKKSIISMSDARGTMGYVAPEVWNRNFGGVSHKSDVYSYGMMLLEMVGGRKNINAEANHTSEIYFPYWVYKRLELGSDLGLDGLMTFEENVVAKKMTTVGLWCIQTIPNDRPTISKVIDMLEGDINSLEMPPKPFLSSPPRSEAESSSP